MSAFILLQEFPIYCSGHFTPAPVLLQSGLARRGGDGGGWGVMMFALGKSIENGLKFTPENVRFTSCFDCDIN